MTESPQFPWRSQRYAQRSNVREKEVLRVCATLQLTDWVHKRGIFTGEILAWIKNRVGEKLPIEAARGESFDILKGGRNVHCTRFDNEEIDIWALRVDDPDKNVAGRTWSTEIVVGGDPNAAPFLSVRQLVASSCQDNDIAPTTPGFVQQLVENIGLRSGAMTITTQPAYVNNEEKTQLFISHLKDPDRKLPIVALARLPKTEDYPIDAQIVARNIAGLAHVYCLTPTASYKLSQEFGNALSVYDGGVRIYLQNFDRSANPNAHRLFTRSILKYPNGEQFIRREVQLNVAYESKKVNSLGKEVFPYYRIRSAVQHQATQQLKDRSVAEKSELERHQEAEITSLRSENRSMEEQIEASLNLMKETENRALDAEIRNNELRAQIKFLNSALESDGKKPQILGFPPSWENLADWISKNFSGKVELAPAGRRSLKNAQYKSIEDVCTCITWLSETAFNTFISGGQVLRDSPVSNTNFINAPCGADKYDFLFEGHQHRCEWHIKNKGNTRDPERCLRIYYAWDDQRQIIILCHLPSHRRTSMT